MKDFTHGSGEHANSVQDDPGQVLNLLPSFCKGTVLTTVPPVVPKFEVALYRNISSINFYQAHQVVPLFFSCVIFGSF